MQTLTDVPSKRNGEREREYRSQSSYLFNMLLQEGERERERARSAAVDTKRSGKRNFRDK